MLCGGGRRVLLTNLFKNKGFIDLKHFVVMNLFCLFVDHSSISTTGKCRIKKAGE